MEGYVGLKKLPESEGAVLGFEITGKMSPETQQEWTEELDRAIRSHGEISAVIVLKDDGGFGIAALMDYVGWVSVHTDQLRRVAYVSDRVFWKWLVGFERPFAKIVGFDEKHFDAADVGQAWDWVKAA